MMVISHFLLVSFKGTKFALSVRKQTEVILVVCMAMVVVAGGEL